MKRVYVNGGSFFRDTTQTISLNLEKYQSNIVTCNESGAAKSNETIALEVYKNIHNYDIFVLGFTYADRFPLLLGDHTIEMTIGREIDGILPLPKFVDNADFLEAQIQKYKDLHYKFFSNTEYNTLRSRFLIESTINLLKINNKQYILSSSGFVTGIEYTPNWFHDPTKGIYSLTNKLWYPYIDHTTHLNAQGLELLAEDVCNFGQKLNIW